MLSKKVHMKDTDLKQKKNRSQAKKKNNSSKKVVAKQKSNALNHNKKLDVIKKFATKVNVTYFILFLLDIILVIYSARKNIVNYVTIADQDIFVSKTRYLLLGRNYINLIITGFFYVYICVINRFLLQKKITKKFLGWLLVVLVILNLLLFFLFTKRVY